MQQFLSPGKEGGVSLPHLSVGGSHWSRSGVVRAAWVPHKAYTCEQSQLWDYEYSRKRARCLLPPWGLGICIELFKAELTLLFLGDVPVLVPHQVTRLFLFCPLFPAQLPVTYSHLTWIQAPHSTSHPSCLEWLTTSLSITFPEPETLELDLAFQFLHLWNLSQSPNRIGLF